MTLQKFYCNPVQTFQHCTAIPVYGVMRTSFQAASPPAVGFLTMRTSCGEYVTLSEMINYEVTFQRSSRARSFYD